MKKIISLLLALAMLFTLAACGSKEAAPAEPVSFKVIVTDLEGNESTYEYTSNAPSVGEALVAEGLIEAHEASFGLFIDAVDGIAADWDKDQTYWAFYINGEYAVTGIGETEITAGATYNLTLTKGE